MDQFNFSNLNFYTSRLLRKLAQLLLEEVCSSSSVFPLHSVVTKSRSSRPDAEVLCVCVHRYHRPRKPNCLCGYNSRLSLTSQMGCNCLINPMFVGFYAFYYGLFFLRAISSADLPSLGEGPGVQNISMTNRRYFRRGPESTRLSFGLGWTFCESERSSTIFYACRPCSHGFSAHL